MAAPHVAGAIALLRQTDRTLAADDLETILRESAPRLIWAEIG